MLKGYKTYIMGAAGIVTAVAVFLSGDAGIVDTLQIILTAILGMTVRHGISTATS